MIYDDPSVYDVAATYDFAGIPGDGGGGGDLGGVGFLNEITRDLDQPYYTGGGAALPEEFGLPVSVEGRGFLLDLTDELGYQYRYRRTSINLLNTQQATSGGEQAQVPPEIWRRSLDSWTSGAGQVNADREASVSPRFFDSFNVDVWNPWQITLLHGTALLQGLDEGRTWVSTVGPDVLVAAHGTDLYWWGIDLSDPPEHVLHPDTILDVTTDGQALYVLGADGIVVRYLDATTTSEFVTGVAINTGAMLLRYLKGFLVLATGPDLYDISTGTAELIYTHPNENFLWRDGCEGPLAYLLGGQGDRWAIYSMAPKADATTFDVPTQAAPIPDGEVGYSIASYLGYVLVGLNTGWRFGVADNSGPVTLGRLITTANPVRCFEGQDRFVWYGQSADLTTSTAGLGRADLSTFVGPLTPAYANDLSTDVDVGAVWSVTSFGVSTGGVGRRVFAVDGAGVYVETDDLAASGWLEQGSINFATSDQKMGLYAQMYYAPLVGSIELAAAFDAGDFVSLANATFLGSISAGKIKIERPFNTIRLKYTLHRSEVVPTTGPTLTRAEVRVLPVSGRAVEFRIPLVIAEEYGHPLNQTRDVRADLDLLDSLVQTKRPFTYREGTHRYRLYVNDFIFLPLRFTWNTADLQGTYVLLAREIG